MIVNTNSQDIEVIGDIKEFKTSIDPKNLEYITTLLSSNLYSAPEQSFIREIVSNAWDSHVEAGTTDTPVIIKFSNRGSSWEISIRDFGTGLSPERVQEVYCNIGSSTKRDSNDYIGGFGIGRFSALSCSNTVYITSYFEGKEFLYMMVKSGNVITVNFINEMPTKEKNGVEVTLKNIRNIYPYTDALNYIIFFPNIYVEGIQESINEIQIKEFKNFTAASTYVRNKLLLGNVLYPCNYELLNCPESKSFLWDIRDTGIVLKFNIGDICVTPNREDIIYTPETIDKINKKIKEAKEELNTLIIQKISKDYDNLYELNSVLGPLYYNPICDTLGLYRNIYRNIPGGTYGTNLKTLNTYEHITYRGRKIRQDECFIINDFFKMSYLGFNTRGVIYDNKLHISKIPSSIRDTFYIGRVTAICLPELKRFTRELKGWLIDTYDPCCIITPVTKEDFRDFILKYIPMLNSTLYDNRRDELINIMYDYFISSITNIDITTNKDFLYYKESIKKTKQEDTKSKESYTLYVYRSNSPTQYKCTSLEEGIKVIRELKKGVILVDSLENNCFADIVRQRGMVLVRTKKSIAAKLQNCNISCIKSKEWLENDKVTIKLHTLFNSGNNINFSRIWMILDTIPYPIKSEFVELKILYDKYSRCHDFIRFATKQCNKEDEHIKSICEKLHIYETAYAKVRNDFLLVNFGNNDLTEALTKALLLKNKTYRIDYDSYKEVKNNKILKVLCKR